MEFRGEMKEIWGIEVAAVGFGRDEEEEEGNKKMGSWACV